MRAYPQTWFGAWCARRRAATFATVMNATLSALGGTVAANMPYCTRLLAGMLTEEILAARMKGVIGSTTKGRRRGFRELLALPASCRAPFGAAGPFDVANLGTADFTRRCGTSHASRVLAAG